MTLDPPANPLARFDASGLRAARHGVIVACAAELASVRKSRWPLIASLDMYFWAVRQHRRETGDRCRLYYSQPRRFPNFLALKFVVSTRDCSLGTFRRALEALDALAELKQCDAILCDAWNPRLTDRALRREGWEPHAAMRWHRNYIKRFYGDYRQERPTSRMALAELAHEEALA